MIIQRKKLYKNITWLLFGRIGHMVLSFVIGLLTARYLGPNNYGIINYAGAYTTFFTAFCTLGINSVIIKDFIDHPDEEGEAIGTTLVLRLLSSFFSLCMISGIVWISENDKRIAVVVFLYNLCLLFNVFDTFNSWFQSKLLSKYYAISTLISFSIASAYRFVLLVNGKSVEWFAVANSVDHCLLALLLYVFYLINHGPKLSFSFKKAKELLSVSCSYILSGLMIAIYVATDKIMLKYMLDEASVGYYSLATSTSTMWCFILTAIIDSLKPIIMKYHNEDKEKYIATNQKLYAIVFYLSLLASLCITIAAPLFIKIVYGEAYLPSVSPLRIVVWYVAFSYLGVARDTWIVCERKQKKMKYLYICSAITNVVVNFILIPLVGVNGAALATLVTQFSTIFIFPWFIMSYRPNAKMMLDAIMLKGIIRKKHEL